MTAPEILSALSLSGVVLGFIIQHFTIMNKLQERLKGVEIKSDLFWKIVETEMPRLLHSPHSVELDTLLEKMEEDKLDECAAKELKKLLVKERDESNPDFGKKLTIVLLLARLNQKFEDK